VVVKLILDEVADPYVESAAIEAAMVQVPTETNATKPLVELIVQIEAVELVKVLVPVPADAVAVRVGGVATIVYVDVYEPEAMVRVLVAKEITKVTALFAVA
jgi:hypothetical protein